MSALIIYKKQVLRPFKSYLFHSATAVAILDEVKNSGKISENEFPKVVGRISFFVNAGNAIHY